MSRILSLIMMTVLLFLSSCDRPPVVTNRKLTLAAGTPTTTKFCSGSDRPRCETTFNLEVIYSFEQTSPGSEVNEVLISDNDFDAPCRGILLEFTPLLPLTYRRSTEAGSRNVSVKATVPCDCPNGSLGIRIKHEESPPGSTTPFVSALARILIPACF